MDPQGDAIAVWERSTGSGSSLIESAVRPARTGVWQTPVPLSHEGQTAYSPEIALDSQGDAIVVWDRHGISDSIVEAAARLAGSGAWQAPVALSAESQNAEGPDVAMDAQGNAVAVWQQRDVTQMIQAAVRPAGSETWQAPVGLSAVGENASIPQVAVDPQGDAVVVWTGSNGGNRIVEATTRGGVSSMWQAPVALSSSSDEASEPEVAIDPQGNAVAVWQTSTGTNEIIDAAFMSAGSGVWQSPVAVSIGGTSLIGEFPQVALDPQGDAVAVWDQSNGSDYIVEAAVRSAASGAWQVPTQLSPTGENSYLPQVAVDPQGNAVAIWENDLIEAAGYDAAGPLLHSLTIPGTGTVGQPLLFSVSPLDVWSILGPTTWSFGDGANATGTSVAHVYTTAGNYHVTVTGADVLGNTTSATGTVAVGSPAMNVIPCACNPFRVLLLYGAYLTNKRFRVAGQATAISADAPLGTRFGFTLSAPARLRITITRTAPGLRYHRGCVAPTATLTDNHAKRCTRTLTLGTLTRSNEHSGTDSIFFSGRIGHRALSPHAYKALIEARNTSTREDTTLSFTVVR
jgi:PKD domain